MPEVDVVWLCATPRVGMTVLIDALRGAIPEQSTTAHLFGTHWPDEPPAGERHHYVSLARRDRVAQAVSWSVAAAVGRFHSDQTPAAVGPTFDRADVERALASITNLAGQWETWLAGRPVLRLTFEDDIRPDPTAAAARVLAFAGLPGRPRQPTLAPVDTAVKAAWRAAWDGSRSLYKVQTPAQIREAQNR